MDNDNLINIPQYSDFDADWDGQVDLTAGGTDQDFSGYTGVLRVAGGVAYANASMDHVREGATYGRVLNTHIASGKPIKLAESGGRDLTVVLGASNRVLTLGANVSVDQNLRQADSVEFGGLTVGSLGGILLGTAGVVSAITNNSSNWDDAFTHKSNDGSDHSKVGANETAIGLNTTHRGLASGNPHSVTPTELSLVIGTNTQAFGAVLDDLNTLGAAASDGQFIVATGAGAFAYESGATLRTSIGLGTGASPVFTGLDLTGITDGYMPYVGAGGIAASGLFYNGTFGFGTAGAAARFVEIKSTSTPQLRITYDADRYLEMAHGNIITHSATAQNVDFWVVCRGGEGTGGNDILFKSGPADGLSDVTRLILKYDGKVGVNDENPAEILDVDGNINATGVLKIDDTQVVKERQVHIVDAPGDTAANNATTINEILAMLEAHGLVAST